MTLSGEVHVFAVSACSMQRSLSRATGRSHHDEHDKEIIILFLAEKPTHTGWYFILAILEP